MTKTMPGLGSHMGRQTTESPYEQVQHSKAHPEEILQLIMETMQRYAEVEHSEHWERAVQFLFLFLFETLYKTLTLGKKRHKADAGFPELQDEEARDLVSLGKVFSASKNPSYAAWVH